MNAEREPLRPPCSECGRDWSEAIWHDMQPDARPVCRQCWKRLWDKEHGK